MPDLPEEGKGFITGNVHLNLRALASLVQLNRKEVRCLSHSISSQVSAFLEAMTSSSSLATTDAKCAEYLIAVGIDSKQLQKYLTSSAEEKEGIEEIDTDRATQIANALNGISSKI